MSKIATELEARTIGGGTLSVIDNKCCTKARALELGCQIKSGFSYTDNQLVENHLSILVILLTLQLLQD